MKKFLIVGLGNIGATYHNTRHNIGFDALDILAAEKELSFEELRYGALTKTRFKGRTLLLLKPSTFMNNSGKAVRYWALKEKIPLENILIITDDLNLPFGTLRLKTKGSDGGHNGLKDIQAQLNTTNYARLRFGIHSEEKGYDTVDFVLGKWSTDEQKALKERCEMMVKMIYSFATQGAQNTMNQFNGK
ncbi:MAG: aminoacyl-tRNA hydrolase [Flavobacteriaceae bacterium]